MHVLLFVLDERATTTIKATAPLGCRTRATDAWAWLAKLRVSVHFWRNSRLSLTRDVREYSLVYTRITNTAVRTSILLIGILRLLYGVEHFRTAVPFWGQTA